ncbi:hypothetical protein [Actinomadura macrotermitis]|uniref:Uncharacterized protein n=1 Tax=Actinomadura macrotermitis TaxID=2585200 RepID=A0A7K0BRT6_9ACTN|nr:hypothetical protein [Actinomadura macrotermitis]MQY03847.1 hypothetical protein [Actinomadura macrotermitis]
MSYLFRFAVLASLVAGVAWWQPWRQFTDSLHREPGFREHVTDEYRLAYPSEWTTVRKRDRQGTFWEEFNGPATENGAYSGQARVAAWTRWPYQLQDKLVQYRASAGRNGYRILKEERIVVKGAVAAHRFEVAQQTRTATGALVPLRGTETFALTADHILVDLSVRAPEKDYGTTRLPQILASFEVRQAPNGLIDKVKNG